MKPMIAPQTAGRTGAPKALNASAGRTMTLGQISARVAGAVKESARSKVRAERLAERMVASGGKVRSATRVPGQCPVCGAEFLPIRVTQVTCGEPKCSKLHSMAKVTACECGRGPKISRLRGCACCEADDRTFWESVKAHRERLAAAAREDWQERVGMSAYAKEWSNEHKGPRVAFNPAVPLSA